MRKYRGIVAVVGRPNVGKSMLFNALTRSRDALVHDMPGVTRDRIYGRVEFADKEDEYFWLIDTGGFERVEGSDQNLISPREIWRQTEQAIEESDVVVLLVDLRHGLHPHDQEIMTMLRPKGKNIILVANKSDSEGLDHRIHEFSALGVENMIPISAAHQRNTGVLRELISTQLNQLDHLATRKTGEDAAVSIAIVGRPNVGKSSLLNRLIGEPRALVSEVAGTTRDSIDSHFRYMGEDYVLVDTAGIRKRSKVKESLEVLSVLKSLRAIEQAEIVVLVVDVLLGFAEQESRLASLALQQHKALLIVINKWDLVDIKGSNTTKILERSIKDRMPDLETTPFLYVSCRNNQRVFNIFAEIASMRRNYERRVTTSELNRALETMVHEHTPAIIRKYSKRVKFFYATQVQSSPPTIVVKCNVAEEIQESYKRYLNHRMRAMLGFENVPLRLIFRGKDASDFAKSSNT